MRFRIIGQPNDSGIGTHYYNYTQALKQIGGINQIIDLINFQDNAALRNASETSQHDDVNLALVPCNLNGNIRGTNINWGVFESTRIPGSIRQTLKENDLWVPSEWGRKIAIANGCDVNRIEVVPEGVDGDIFHPYLNAKDPARFRFLFIGKSEARKSILETLTAFAEEFGDDPAVELTVKSDFFRNPTDKYYELTAEIERLRCKNICLVWGHQTTNEMANLYRSSNVFVLPTKAEGWGLPLIEAAASGLPLVTTFYSAQTEFLKDIRSSCVFVPYELCDIDCAEYREFYPDPEGDYGQWAVPTVQAIRTAMRRAYKDYDALSRQAMLNSEVIRNQYSWHVAAVKSLGVLKKNGLI
jgi:glycosyltransferase involved in cell wall biosynthesis